MTGLFIEQGRLLSTWSWSSWSCAVAVGSFGHRNSFSSHGFDSAGDRTLFGLRFSRFGSGLVRSVAPSDLLWLQRAESSSARFNQLRDGARAEGSGETAIYYGRPSPYRGAVSVQCRASGQKRWLIFDCTVASRAGVEGLTKLFVIPIDCGSTQIGIVRRE